MKLRIEKPVYGGAGLARAAGKAVFVPLTLPGEEVEAALRRDKGSFAEAELLELLEAAPERVEAPCPYYGACGGCQYQHAAYPAQLAMKRAILEETLSRAGLRDLPEIAVHAGEPWGYRNRIRLHVDPATSAIGYRRRGSHALLPVETCPLAAPTLQAAIPALGEVLQAHHAGSWCAEVELFTDEAGARLLLSFGLRQSGGAEPRSLELLCQAAGQALPQLHGAAAFTLAGARGRSAAREITDEPEGESAAGRVLEHWGEQQIEYRVGAESYSVSLGAFFQGNRFLVGSLLELVAAGAQGGLAWDLFAGVGLFARALSRVFHRVVAVEAAPVSSGDLRRNLPGKPHRAVESSTLAFLQSARRDWPDLVVVDPPRAGLGKEGSRLLAQIGPRDVTYVSCDPATLARDLRVFADSGYTITRLDLLDMFPQTFHMEAVAKLRRE